MLKYNKIIRTFFIVTLLLSIISAILLIVSIVMSSSSLANKVEQSEGLSTQIPEGTYIFVSFSMNKESLHSYFLEAEPRGAKLVIRGLVGEKHSKNRFVQTKAKIEEAKINVDINPNLFEQLDIKQVPAMAVVQKDGSIKKIYGHISLKKALELMNVDEDKK